MAPRRGRRPNTQRRLILRGFRTSLTSPRVTAACNSCKMHRLRVARKLTPHDDVLSSSISRRAESCTIGPIRATSGSAVGYPTTSGLHPEADMPSRAGLVRLGPKRSMRTVQSASAPACGLTKKGEAPRSWQTISGASDQAAGGGPLRKRTGRNGRGFRLDQPEFREDGDAVTLLSGSGQAKPTCQERTKFRESGPL